MSFAVIKTGGKQYLVEPNQIISVEKLGDFEVDQEVTFDEVMLHSEGDKLSVGAPFVSGKKVTAKVVEHGKGDKISIIRFKSKSNYRKKTGHRQPYTKLQILSV